MLWVKISFLLVPFNSAENLQTNVASIKSTWIHKQNAKDRKKNSCYILHGDWIIQFVWNTHGWLAACIESPDACSFWYKVKNFSIQFWMRMCQLLYNVNAIYIRSGTEQKEKTNCFNRFDSILLVFRLFGTFSMYCFSNSTLLWIPNCELNWRINLFTSDNMRIL